METHIFFFSPPSLCFFPPLCTSRCLSWRPTPVLRSSLSARSQWCSCPAWPHAGSGLPWYPSIPALRLWALQTGALAVGVRHPPQGGVHQTGAPTRERCTWEKSVFCRAYKSDGSRDRQICRSGGHNWALAASISTLLHLTGVNTAQSTTSKHPAARWQDIWFILVSHLNTFAGVLDVGAPTPQVLLVWGHGCSASPHSRSLCHITSPRVTHRGLLQQE